MSLLFNILSRFVSAFLPRSKCLKIMAAVTISSDFGTQENKVSHCFHCFPIYWPWSDRTGCHDLSFLNVEFKPAFSLSSFTFIKKLFSSSLLSAIRMMSSAYLRLLIFLLAIHHSWSQILFFFLLSSLRIYLSTLNSKSPLNSFILFRIAKLLACVWFNVPDILKSQ